MNFKILLQSSFESIGNAAYIAQMESPSPNKSKLCDYFDRSNISG